MALRDTMARAIDDIAITLAELRGIIQEPPSRTPTNMGRDNDRARGIESDLMALRRKMFKLL